MPFKKGNKLGGRPAGVPNKVTKAITQQILDSLEAAGGQEYLQKLSIDDPKTFVSLIRAVVPREQHVDLTAKVDFDSWLLGQRKGKADTDTGVTDEAEK